MADIEKKNAHMDVKPSAYDEEMIKKAYIPDSNENLVTAVAVEDDDGPILIAKELDEKVPFHRTNKFKILMGSGLCGAIILAVGVSLGVTQPWKEKTGTLSPTQSPTKSPTSERDVLWSRVEDLVTQAGGDKELAKDTSSPQYLAGDWILNKDALQLDPKDPTFAQRYALAVIYYSTTGDNWTQCSYNEENATNFCNEKQDKYAFMSGQSECVWYGVECIDPDVETDVKFVSELVLDYNNLDGPIPNEIMLLQQLSILHLYDNYLNGTLPSQLGELSYLTAIELGNNMISGSIPEEIYKIDKLDILTLNDNDLTGTISENLKDLVALKGLWLGANQLNGTIPDVFDKVEYLAFFDIHENKFTGPVPMTITSVRFLERLDLSGVQFGGTINSEFGSMTNLGFFDLSSCDLSGTIPEELYEMSALTTFILSKNRLSGTISPKIGQLTDMSLLDLESNYLSGSLPSELAMLKNIKTINIRKNNLSGTIPESYKAFTDLDIFLINNNENLSGVIHPDMCYNGIVISDCLETFGDPLVQCPCCDYCCDPRAGQCDEMPCNPELMDPETCK